MDLYPSVWGKLIELMTEGRLFTPVEVINELKRGDDAIVSWVKDEAIGLAVKEDEEVLNIVKEIGELFPDWVDPDREYTVADPFIVACAVVKNQQYNTDDKDQYECIIVTEESDDLNRLKIPKVAKEFEVETLKIYDMFRKESWSF